MQELDQFEDDFTRAAGPMPAHPPLDLLRAAGQGVLPAATETKVAHHLQHCTLCTMLLADFAQLPEAPFTTSQQQRIRTSLPATPQQKPGHTLAWVGTIAAAALLTASGVASYRTLHRMKSADTAATGIPATAPTARPIPNVAIAFAKLPPPPGIAPGLTTRGVAAPSKEPPATELLPAFNAYNHSQYDEAVRQFTALASVYPRSSIAPLYLGISQLFLSQNEDALTSLTHATETASATTKNPAAWYRAVAALRAHSHEAPALFHALCQDAQNPATASSYSQQACTVDIALNATN